MVSLSVEEIKIRYPNNLRYHYMGKLVIEHLYKEYEKDKIVIRDINLRIDDGEFFVLLGPSGCGKTTLLNIIAGIESATSGKVYIDDQDCTIIPSQKRNIAVVFQNYSLYPNMTVLSFSIPYSNAFCDTLEISSFLAQIA